MFPLGGGGQLVVCSLPSNVPHHWTLPPGYVLVCVDSSVELTRLAELVVAAFVSTEIPLFTPASASDRETCAAFSYAELR